MHQGTVSKYLTDRGYGWIVPDGGYLRDVFFHWRAIEGMDGWRALNVGDRVMFDIEQAEKGPQARTVRLIDASTDAADDEDE